MSETVTSLPFDLPLPPIRKLHAGEISCLYEHGALRRIVFGGEEVVSIIYAAVRDVNWETATCELENETITENKTSFEISYLARYLLNDIHYQSQVNIIGDENNTIVFKMNGEALSTFAKMRIGLCVHHPIESCKGKKVTVTRPDKSQYNAFFPGFISPHQPFKEIREMTWITSLEHCIQLSFRGDVFETEDQRNWADNSYKTYSTPLDKPSPVIVHEGERIEQQIKLSIHKISGTVNYPGYTNSEKQEEINQAIPINQRRRRGTDLQAVNLIHEEHIGVTAPDQDKEHKIIFPQIGYGRPRGSVSLTDLEIQILNRLPFGHYRVELIMYDDGWQVELSNAITESRKLNTMLELIVVFSERFEKELEMLLPGLSSSAGIIRSLLPLHKNYDVTPASLITYLYPLLKMAYPNIEIGYGTNLFFAELNRNRPATFDYDFVSFTLNPQVHMRDLRSLIENKNSHHQIIESTSQFTSKPVHISPVTFQPQHDLMPDTRLHSWFGAAWTLLTLKNLAPAGHITFYQTIGARGVSSGLSSTTSEPSPLMSILMQLKAFDPRYLIINKSVDPTVESKLANATSGSAKFGNAIFEDPKFKDPKFTDSKFGYWKFGERITFENSKGSRLTYLVSDPSHIRHS